MSRPFSPAGVRLLPFLVSAKEMEKTHRRGRQVLSPSRCIQARGWGSNLWTEETVTVVVSFHLPFYKAQPHFPWQEAPGWSPETIPRVRVSGHLSSTVLPLPWSQEPFSLSTSLGLPRPQLATLPLPAPGNNFRGYAPKPASGLRLKSFRVGLWGAAVRAGPCHFVRRPQRSGAGSWELAVLAAAEPDA